MAKPKKLSKRQQEVYDFVAQRLWNSQSSTFREIGEALGGVSTSAVHEHVKAVIKKGWLRWNRRNLELVEWHFGGKSQAREIDVDTVETLRLRERLKRAEKRVEYAKFLLDGLAIDLDLARQALERNLRGQGAER